ncbi:hypothetical protein D3C86_2136440 [compost metagenome]
MFRSTPRLASSVLISVSSNGLRTVLIALTSAVVTSLKILPSPPTILPDGPYILTPRLLTVVVRLLTMLVVVKA